VAPLAGEQILTVLSTVAVHTAEATFAEPRRRVAARKTRSEITWGPVSEHDFTHNLPTNATARTRMRRIDFYVARHAGPA
jgi:hypothetical protein